MAPSKRSLKEAEEGKKMDPTTDISSSSRRITRSMTSATPAAVAVAPPMKKAKKSTKTAKKVLEGSGNTADVTFSSKTTVVIEHCKQCNSFKTRAVQVKEGLEKAVSGVVVQLNPENPRRGCFEIRQEGGETFISLLDMKRPFKPMKDLNMDEVISGIVEKLEAA